MNRMCSLLSIGLVAVACSDKTPAPAPESKAVTAAPARAPAPPPPITDPRMTDLFNEGKDCKWSAEGILQACPTADKIQKLTFENQGDDKLAAACMTVVADRTSKARVMAAWCMHGFNGITQAPLFAQALDVIQTEQDLPVRNALAFSFGSVSAVDAKVEARVIALVRKMATNAEDDFTASSLLDTLFPQYLMSAAKTPSKAAGDLALDMVKKNGTRLQMRALEVLALLTDRTPDVCAAYGDVIQGAGDDWAKGVYALAALKDACPAQVDPVLQSMTKAMVANKYNTYEYQGTKRYLGNVTLTAAQRAKLVPACDKLTAKADGVWKDSAKEIAALCHKKR